MSQRRFGWSRQFNTFVFRYGENKIITGVTGLDRPSLIWHAAVRWRLWRAARRTRSRTSSRKE